MQHYNLVIVLLLAVATLAAVELREVQNVYSEDGWLNLTLVVEPAEIICDPLCFTTRSYNSSIPGPTWNIYPGDKIYLTLINDLGPNNDSIEIVENWFHSPNTTAMHVHGLHGRHELLRIGFRQCTVHGP